MSAAARSAAEKLLLSELAQFELAAGDVRGAASASTTGRPSKDGEGDRDLEVARQLVEVAKRRGMVTESTSQRPVTTTDDKG